MAETPATAYRVTFYQSELGLVLSALHVGIGAVPRGPRLTGSAFSMYTVSHAGLSALHAFLL